MEHRTEEGDPLLKLRFSIVTHPIHWYIIVQQISVYVTLRYRLNHHAIVVRAAFQAVVCGTICLQAACLRNTPQLTYGHSTIHSTLTNIAFDLLGVGNTGTACL